MKEKKGFYQRKWFLWICLIVFAPLGIVLLWKVHKSMKKWKKIILSIVFVLWFAALYGSNDSGQKDVVIYESEIESEESETDEYGWSINDYIEFDVALKTISKEYLTNYNLPGWNEWQFGRFNDEGKIIAMTRNLTFKDEHEKHVCICVFKLSGEVDKNGFHDIIEWSYFGTDEKIYYDDGTCKEVFENLKTFVQ